MFSPARQYGAGEMVVYDGSGNGKNEDNRGFYEKYISPVFSYVSPKAAAAYQYAKEKAYTAGRGVKSGAKAIGRGARATGRGAKWTYKKVLVPTSRFAKDYVLKPTYRGLKEISPHAGRFARDYILSPTYEAGKKYIPMAGRAAYKHIGVPLAHMTASQAKKFHKYMMNDQAEEGMPTGAPEFSNPEAYHCANPYNRRNATTKDRVKSCSKGGRSHPSFSGQGWPNLQQCIESCNY
jgi:hypothetical protein